ncbi:hypothetical protein [Streptomyces sp. NPDC052494]|uniref:hypothetical protein n=1 Tax=Streptomyces sp. NPDC052494 TaxID=3365692 RepID=UPI0037D3D5E5
MDVTALEELVADAERASPEDPLMCDTIRRALILELAASGEIERAVALAAEAIEKSSRRYGAEDSRTFMSRLVEVHVLQQSGQAERAGALKAVLLEDCLRVVGECELTTLLRRMEP